ncbi:hypothetical protein FALCPG4_011439 [Fusarium falciforme]
MASEKRFEHFRFCYIRDLLPGAVGETLDEHTYLQNVSRLRADLMEKFGSSDWKWDEIREDADVICTYQGYLQFLKIDLQDVLDMNEDITGGDCKRTIKTIAREMIRRGQKKIPISLLPDTALTKAPWHCSVAYRLDGAISSDHREVFDKDEMMELVYKHGQPSYFREKSAYLHWGEHKGGIVCKTLYPCGCMIEPAGGAEAMTIDNIDGAKVRALAKINSPIIMRGFSDDMDEKFVDRSWQFGTPVPWKFGIMLKVKDENDTSLNNVLSAEPMPFHFNGTFKTIMQTNDTGEEVNWPTPCA